MGIGNLLGFSWGAGSTELPNIFPLAISQANFVSIDIENIYRKILTDMFERTSGLNDDDQALLWDNCLASECSYGLISLLACAMAEKKELFLVIDPATKVLRKASATEIQTIRSSYEKKAEPVKLAGVGIGVFISFKNYHVVDMIRVYSALEFCTVASLNKTMNTAKSLQIKIDGLRGSVSMADSSVAIAQAQTMAKALGEGKDIMTDSKDIIEALQPDLSPTKASMELLNEKRAFYLNMPASYITGVLNSGLGDTGQADVKAVERGLKVYFFQIGKPVCNALFEKKVEFRTEDFQLISTGLEAMKTFDLTSDEYMASENKLKTVNKLFGLPIDTKGGPPEPTTPPVDPNVKPPAPGAQGGSGY